VTKSTFVWLVLALLLLFAWVLLFPSSAFSVLHLL